MLMLVARGFNQVNTKFHKLSSTSGGYSRAPVLAGMIQILMLVHFSYTWIAPFSDMPTEKLKGTKDGKLQTEDPSLSDWVLLK